MRKYLFGYKKDRIINKKEWELQNRLMGNASLEKKQNDNLKKINVCFKMSAMILFLDEFIYPDFICA